MLASATCWATVVLQLLSFTNGNLLTFTWCGVDVKVLGCHETLRRNNGLCEPMNHEHSCVVGPAVGHELAVAIAEPTTRVYSVAKPWILDLLPVKTRPRRAMTANAELQLEFQGTVAIQGPLLGKLRFPPDRTPPLLHEWLRFALGRYVEAQDCPPKPVVCSSDPNNSSGVTLEISQPSIESFVSQQVPSWAARAVVAVVSRIPVELDFLLRITCEPSSVNKFSTCVKEEGIIASVLFGAVHAFRSSLSPTEQTFQDASMTCNASMNSGISVFPRAGVIASRVLAWFGFTQQTHVPASLKSAWRYQARPIHALVDLPKPPCVEPLKKIVQIGTETASLFQQPGSRMVIPIPKWLLETILNLQGG